MFLLSLFNVVDGTQIGDTVDLGEPGDCSTCPPFTMKILPI